MEAYQAMTRELETSRRVFGPDDEDVTILGPDGAEIRISTTGVVVQVYRDSRATRAARVAQLIRDRACR